MYIPFENIPQEARIWIYQADRQLMPEEVDWLKKVATSFCEQWAAHGQDLISSFEVYFDQFLVLSVDEKASLPSGCSIDSSVHLINQVQAKLGIDFFDRMNVAFLEKGEVILEKFKNVKTKIEEGEITEQTRTFNNLVTTKHELERRWQLPAGESWLKKYFV